MCAESVWGKRVALLQSCPFWAATDLAVAGPPLYSTACVCVCVWGGACSFGRPAAAGIVQTAWVETLLEEACPEVVQPLPAPGLWLHSSVPDDLTLSSLPQSVGSQSAGSAGSECRVRSFVLACGGFWGRRGALQHDGGLLAVMQCRLQQPADVGVGQAACSLQLLHSHLQALRRRTVDCIV